jgi:hypothetical protein
LQLTVDLNLREKISLKHRFKNYFDDPWNYLDITCVLLFSIGISFRFISYFANLEDLFNISRLAIKSHFRYINIYIHFLLYFKFICKKRIILSIDLCARYIRLLRVAIVIEWLGPKLVIMKAMLRDLLFFILIIMIFLCSFGVITQANLRPYENQLN